MGIASSPAAPPLIQLHTNSLGEKVKDYPYAWASATQTGDQDEAPGFGLTQP